MATAGGAPDGNLVVYVAAFWVFTRREIASGAACPCRAPSAASWRAGQKAAARAALCGCGSAGGAGYRAWSGAAHGRGQRRSSLSRLERPPWERRLWRSTRTSGRPSVVRGQRILQRVRRKRRRHQHARGLPRRGVLLLDPGHLRGGRLIAAVRRSPARKVAARWTCSPRSHSGVAACWRRRCSASPWSFRRGSRSATRRSSSRPSGGAWTCPQAAPPGRSSA